MIRGRLSQSEFSDIFSKVPRLTVEIVLISSKCILLTKRQLEPCKGMWHMPGGTVRIAEPLTQAVKRVAVDELGDELVVGNFIGYIEYHSHYEKGLDSPVGMAFKTSLQSDLKDFKVNDNRRWFAKLPANMHEEQKQFIVDHQLLEK